ncbi:MAG: arylesterase [Burkholderiaceae bacterium]
MNPLNRFLRLFAAVLLGLGLLTACQEKPLQPLPPGSTILAFGDSLTEGKGVALGDSYPAVLERISGIRVVNAGISGEITAEGLARLPQVLDDVRPQLMLLLHGGNDILRNLSPAQASANIAAMIQEARSRGIAVVLVGVPEKKLFSDTSPIYPALAEQFNLVFVESIIADLLRSPSKKSDAVHFNQAGYADIAEELYDTLQAAGAL